MDTVLLNAIRRGMGLSGVISALSDEECTELYSFGIRQCILPIIWQGIKASGISDDWKDKFKKRCAMDFRAFVLRDYSLDKIRNALDSETIPYIFLKGAFVRDLYPEAWMRTSSDIDILVHSEDLERAVEIIEAKTDYKMDKKGYHDVSMLSDYFHLELHFSLKENSEEIDSLLSKVWKYAIPIGKGSQNVLTPEYQIFHVVAHMSYHFLHSGLGVRPFIDLWLLRNKTSYNEEKIRMMCESCGILKFYEVCSELATCWMEDRPIEGMIQEFEQYCLQGGVFGSQKQSYALRQKDKKGISYILSRVFVPDYYAREFYGDGSGKNHSYLYYQVKRWKNWLGKESRQELTKQTRAVLSTDEKIVASTQSLIHWLEL